MKETLKITELVGELCPDELGVSLEHPLVSTDRVLDILQARGVLTKPPVRRKRHSSRLAVRLAIAAALVLGLSVTAYAVYQAMMEDYLVETPTQLDAVIEDLGGDTDPGTTLSLVGYQGTPEYEAYTEWEAWRAEHYGEHTSDNSLWHETPDNYYELYGAAWQDQADALDQIAAKYGVRLHESRAIADAEDIYDLLGSEAFLSDEYAGSSGYIYNDGSFMLDFIKYRDNVYDNNDIFVSVKGTFTMASAVIDTTGGYEEWSYQTASGPMVDLVLTPVNSHIFFETESAHIHVGSVRMTPEATVPHTRESLEALADSVDFTELAKVFGEGASFELTQAVEELDRRYEQEAKEREERLQRGLAEDNATSLEVVEEMGSYGLVPIPEGYERSDFYWDGMEPLAAEGRREDGSRTIWGTTVSENVVYTSYGNDAGEGMLLCYTRYYTDESRTAIATAEQFEAARTYYGAFEGFRECQVNGCPGFYFPSVQDESGGVWDPGVMWLDEVHDLVFVLYMMDGSYFDEQTGEVIFTGDPFTPEELITLAATVTEE